MGASAKATTNASAIPDARVMMFLLLRSSASEEGGTMSAARLSRAKSSQARRTSNGSCAYPRIRHCERLDRQKNGRLMKSHACRRHARCPSQSSGLRHVPTGSSAIKLHQACDAAEGGMTASGTKRGFVATQPIWSLSGPDGRLADARLRIS